MRKDLLQEESFKPQYLYIEKESSQICPKNEQEADPLEEESGRGVLVIDIL